MASSERTNYHVRQNSSGQWDVQEEGSNRPSSTHSSKTEAQNEAHNQAERNRPSSYVTHSSNDDHEESRNTYD